NLRCGFGECRADLNRRRLSHEGEGGRHSAQDSTASRRSTAAPPRRATHRGESGAEKEERGRRWYVRHVRSHLKLINSDFAKIETAGELKVSVFDDVQDVKGSGRQRDGSRI